MLNFAHRLISEELKPADPSDSAGRAALRVCDKLRQPLVTFVGVDGFRSLLSRALVLAKADMPWLARVQIQPDGCLLLPAEFEAELASDEVTKGTAAVVAELLGLLVTFIGEALMLRLVQDVWPTAAFNSPNPEGKSYEKET